MQAKILVSQPRVLVVNGGVKNLKIHVVLVLKIYTARDPLHACLENSDLGSARNLSSYTLGIRWP